MTRPTYLAAVQFLPRPIYHGVGYTEELALADAAANGATDGLRIVPITERLLEAILAEGGDISPGRLIYGSARVPHDLAT